MSKLTRDDVLKLARLSRLRLTDDEIEKFRSELSGILEYVGALDKVDTANLEPTYQVTGLTNVSRKDEPRDYAPGSDALLKNAPSLEDNQFKVKRVL